MSTQAYIMNLTRLVVDGINPVHTYAELIMPWRRIASMTKNLPLLFLLLASILGGGCASTGGDGRTAPRDRLPFPASYPHRLHTTTEPGTGTVASVVGYTEYRDPIIWFNRAMFGFNDVTYRFLLIPLAKGYTWVVPDPAERCIGNFFHNIKSPIYLVNHLLQLEGKAAGRDLARFGVNSTVGLLGLFDPASSWLDIKKEETHFEATLEEYGAGYGFYLVLPILGPSDMRKLPSTVVDYFLNPIPYVVDMPESTYIGAYDYFQDFAPSAEDYQTLRKQSDDPYIFFRNLYLQGVQRDAEYQKAR